MLQGSSKWRTKGAHDVFMMCSITALPARNRHVKVGFPCRRKSRTCFRVQGSGSRVAHLEPIDEGLLAVVEIQHRKAGTGAQHPRKLCQRLGHVRHVPGTEQCSGLGGFIWCTGNRVAYLFVDPITASGTQCSKAEIGYII